MSENMLPPMTEAEFRKHINASFDAGSEAAFDLIVDAIAIAKAEVAKQREAS